MKKLLLLLPTVIITSLATAQTPSDLVINKYRNEKGVELSVNAQPATGGENNSVSTVMKEMTIYKRDGEKSTGKLYRKVKKDCLKFFKHKDYAVIQQEKDEHESFTAFKYTKNGILEMCFLTISDEMLTIELTQTTGLTEKAIANAELNVSRVTR